MKYHYNFIHLHHLNSNDCHLGTVLHHYSHRLALTTTITTIFATAFIVIIKFIVITTTISLLILVVAFLIKFNFLANVPSIISTSLRFILIITITTIIMECLSISEFFAPLIWLYFYQIIQ